MATSEYHDLFLKCQDSGIYHMFCFDIIDSKKMNKKIRNEAFYKMIELMNSIYDAISDIEKNTNTKILVFDDDFLSFKDGIPKGFGFKQEPFLFGDTFGFTVYRDSIDKKVILDLYEQFKVSLNIDFDFHISDGYYETNDVSLSGTKYFRGYCMDVLMNYHKKYIQEELCVVRRTLNLERKQ